MWTYKCAKSFDDEGLWQRKLPPQEFGIIEEALQSPERWDEFLNLPDVNISGHEVAAPQEIIDTLAVRSDKIQFAHLLNFRARALFCETLFESERGHNYRTEIPDIDTTYNKLNTTKYDLLDDEDSLPNFPNIPEFKLKFSPITKSESDEASSTSQEKRNTQKQELLQSHLYRVLQQIRSHTEHSGPFLTPVLVEEVSDYYDVIKNPMDLQTLGKKLNSSLYKNVDDFRQDLDLIWRNCRAYNTSPNSIYRVHAAEMAKIANQALASIPDLDEELDMMRNTKYGSEPPSRSDFYSGKQPASPADIKPHGRIWPGPAANALTPSSFTGLFHSPSATTGTHNHSDDDEMDLEDRPQVPLRRPRHQRTISDIMVRYQTEFQYLVDQSVITITPDLPYPYLTCWDGDPLKKYFVENIEAPPPMVFQLDDSEYGELFDTPPYAEVSLGTPNASPLALQLLQKSVALILSRVGFEEASSQVIELLTNVTANFITTIGDNIRREIEVPGRVQDVERGAVLNSIDTFFGNGIVDIIDCAMSVNIDSKGLKRFEERSHHLVRRPRNRSEMEEGAGLDIPLHYSLLNKAIYTRHDEAAIRAQALPYTFRNGQDAMSGR